MYQRFVNGSGLRIAARLGLAMAAGAATGCVNDLLEFDPGDRVESGTLQGPESAELLVSSAVGDFECAFIQYIVTTSQVTDEMDNSNLSSTEAFQLDRRSVNKERTHYALFPCGTHEGLLTPIQTARFDADQILTSLEGWTDEEVNPSNPGRRTELIATAAAYAGYSYLLLGEGFCSATVDAGPELTQAEVLALAEERFTRAIAAAEAAGDETIRNLALVGRARARLDLGRGADAVADAQLVPEGFEHLAQTSGASARAYNSVYQYNGVGTLITVGPAYVGLTFAGVPDPRVQVEVPGGAGSDNLTPLRLQKKYTSLDQPIRLASYTEAQLIIAEVNGGSAAVDIINALHDAAGLPHFTSSDPAAILTQVIEERSREFFLESQHFYDVKRLDLPLNPAAGTPYLKGGNYGDMRCFPLPDVERDNNPNA
ncbi:MAG TPA: RagB/SusD family nutrient uptake outer membrane protein [Gemmatimonadales bacterium]|nr:RagB/SusD family nutrient uptake outer membrane protein [Gemmatimonadales bacterium]